MLGSHILLSFFSDLMYRNKNDLKYVLLILEMNFYNVLRLFNEETFQLEIDEEKLQFFFENMNSYWNYPMKKNSS